MVFSSVIFLHYFLPAAVVLGVAAQQLFGTKASNAVLLVLSLVFYAWGLGASFLWLLLGSIAVNYALAILAERYRSQSSRSAITAVAVAAVVFNIAILGYFKYANFFVEQTTGLRQLIGLPPVAWETVVLPIGISFFTFHQLSYVFDVLAGRSNALRSPVDLALYICFFPQLIAGPIVRFHQIEEQLHSRSITVQDMGEGAVRFAHGLAKKVIIADPAGGVANLCFGVSPTEMTTAVAWLGAIAYTIQIYFDFSGYSDMAIGLARLFGFKFPENFNRPYAALSITDFWRRWHITLSAWFRDYVYIPLGGSRGAPHRTYANLMIVFALTGFWHGANWTFLIWGLYHGILVIGERLLGIRNVAEDKVVYLSQGTVILRRLIVMLLVIVGWVIFRADDMDKAMGFIGHMVFIDFKGLPLLLKLELAPDDLAIIIIGVGLSLFPAHWRGPDMYRVSWSCTAALLLIALPFALMRVASGSFSPFLYFQF